MSDETESMFEHFDEEEFGEAENFCFWCGAELDEFGFCPECVDGDIE